MLCCCRQKCFQSLRRLVNLSPLRLNGPRPQPRDSHLVPHWLTTQTSQQELAYICDDGRLTLAGVIERP